MLAGKYGLGFSMITSMVEILESDWKTQIVQQKLSKINNEVIEESEKQKIKWNTFWIGKVHYIVSNKINKTGYKENFGYVMITRKKQ